MKRAGTLYLSASKLRLAFMMIQIAVSDEPSPGHSYSRGVYSIKSFHDRKVNLYNDYAID